jgi:6-phosphogluconolactonase
VARIHPALAMVTIMAACSPAVPSPGSGSSGAGAGSTPFVYVGSGEGQITRFSLDERTGALSRRTTFDGGRVPSFLAVSPSRRLLFAVNEAEPGEVSSFTVRPGTGELTLINRAASGGDGPAHLSVDRTGRWLLVANYGGGTAAVVPIGIAGMLGAATDVEASGGKAHHVTVSPDNRFVFVTCLEPNYIAQYRFDAATGTLTPNVPATLVIPGANPGPRHLAFHPGGELAFVVNEHASTVSSLRYDRASGLLSVLETTSALPSPVPGNTGAGIAVHPNGRFVYSSNRGHNSIATFSVDQSAGRLTLIGNASTGGITPRHFSLNDEGTMLFVANQRSGNVVAMRVNPGGTLTSIGEVATQLGSPQWVSAVRVPTN